MAGEAGEAPGLSVTQVRPGHQVRSPMCVCNETKVNSTGLSGKVGR